MRLTAEHLAAFAALEAGWARYAAEQSAKTHEQKLADFVAGQRRAARHFLKLAKAEKAKRKAWLTWNPQALAFYGDNGPSLMRGFHRHHQCAQQNAAKLRELRMQMKAAA